MDDFLFSFAFVFCAAFVVDFRFLTSLSIEGFQIPLFWGEGSKVPYDLSVFAAILVQEARNKRGSFSMGGGEEEEEFKKVEEEALPH